MDSESFNPYVTMSITSFGPPTLPDQKKPAIHCTTRNINSVAGKINHSIIIKLLLPFNININIKT